MNYRDPTVDDLAELPLELFQAAGTLEHAGTAPVLTIKPLTAIVPKTPHSPALEIKKGQVFIREYLTQVLYPRVICYPFGELSDQLVIKAKTIGRSGNDIEARATQEQFYKLTSVKGVALTRPFFCTVKHGPWSARVTEEESCADGVPNRFTLFVVEIPEIVLVWFGTWNEIPSYPLLQVISGDLYQLSETPICCPGFKWCPITGSCISETIKCDDPFPA